MKTRYLLTTTLLTLPVCAFVQLSAQKTIAIAQDPGQNLQQNPSKKGNVTKSTKKRLPGEKQTQEIVLTEEQKKQKVSLSRSSVVIGGYRTVDDLIQACDAIIVGRPTQSFMGRNHYAKVSESGESVYEWTVGNLVIEQVLMQKPGQNLVANQTIPFGEPIGILQYPSGLVKTILEDRFELQPGVRYLLCVQNIGGEYVSLNLNSGRFDLDGKDPFDDINAIHLNPGEKSPKAKVREALLARFPSVSYMPFPAPGFVFPPLTLNSVTPNQVTAGTSTPVSLEIKGSGFLPFSKVRFGNAPLTELSYGDDGFLRATVPANLLANPGVYPVTIFNPTTNANISNPINFTVTGSPVSTLFGTVTLQDFSGSVSAQPLTVRIRDVGSATPRETLTLSPDSAGRFTINTPLQGTFEVLVKASHWLQKKTTLTLNHAQTTFAVSLINGDVNGDNQVTSVDLSLLGRAFNTRPGTPKWNANADLNGDNRIDTVDRNIVTTNLRRIGDR